MAIRDGEIRIRDQRWKKFGSVINMRRYKFLKIFVFQLFGEDDPDQNVSPDTEDPEAAGDQAGEVAAQREANGVSALYGLEKVISVWCLIYT